MSRSSTRMRDAARRSSLRTAVFSAVGVLLVIVTAVFAVLALGINTLNDDAQRARGSEEATKTLNASERSVVDLETGIRGYLLTGQRRFLDPYVAALVTLGSQFADLEALAKGEPAQQARIRGISSAVASYERTYAAPLARGSGRLTRAQDVADTSEGKRLLDALRGRFAEVERVEQLQSAQRRSATSSSATAALTSAAAGLALLVLLVIGLTAYLARAVLTPMRRAARAAKRVGEGEAGITVSEGGLGEVGELASAFNSMSRTLQDRELSLQISNGRLQGILDNANAAIHIKDADGRYLLVNHEFERIRSANGEAVLGRLDSEIGPPDLATQIMASDQAVLRAGVPMSFEQAMHSPDRDRTFLSVKFPIEHEGSTVIGGISTDITDQKEALATAVEASRLKSEFVANMSHEIRTPLNGVVGMTDLLRDSSLDAAQREYANALGASSEALLAIINDILDFSKMEAGHLELDPTNFELRGAVEEACLMLAEGAHAKGLEISHWVDADVPEAVNGDRARLRQILLNLLSNAIKFTASGEVVVRVTADDGDMVRFEISDTGVGIGADHATHLFEAFVQADQSTTRQYGGTGLGLTISRELAHRLGGEIGATPREQGGSVFWFTAELAAATVTKAPVRSCPQLVGLRALIVDDNETNRTIFDHYLRAWGIVCRAVDGPGPAIEMLEDAARRGQPFELALLDFNMPTTNGAELVQAIRDRPALRGLRLVILSSSPLEREDFSRLEISAFLMKPTRQSQLYEAIADAIAGPISGQEPESPVEQELIETAAAPASSAPLVLIAEDNEINQAVAKALLTKSGLLTAIARNGREARDMALANDYAAVLMDCQMPELDGYDATRAIREAEGARHVPIIAMTAHSMPGDRERCLAAGMDDYLSKPVRAGQLKDVIERWVPGYGSTIQASPASSAGASEPASPLNDVLDRGTVIELQHTLTIEAQERLLETFEASLPGSVADIEAAVRHNDRIELTRTAHVLKGSSATLGATRLRLSCLQLEQSGRGEDTEVTEEQLARLRATVSEARDALREQLRRQRA
jgi:two-component system, sensor histidine kinase and response regulator